MALRVDHKEFPYSNRTKGVWYLLVDWKNRNEKDYWTVEHKNNLVKKLREIIDNNLIDNYEIYGIWQGNYSSDVFKLPLNLAYEELSKHF